MIEALAIILVVAVSAGIGFFAWIGARDVSQRNLPAELDQLRQHREVLFQKTVRGREEHWDGEMMGRLAERLAQVDRQITKKTTTSRI